MTVTVEIVRDPSTQVLKAYVTQEGRRGITNLLTGRQFTKVETARNFAGFELRCRYHFAPDLEITFLYPPNERSAQP